MENREKIETVTDFIFLGFKVPVDSDFSHEIKRHLPLRRKAMTNLDSVLKSRKISLTTKVCIVKAMSIPVVMYGCKSWTIKNAKHQTIDTFKLWWKTLVSPLDGKEIKLVNPKEFDITEWLNSTASFCWLLPDIPWFESLLRPSNNPKYVCQKQNSYFPKRKCLFSKTVGPP